MIVDAAWCNKGRVYSAHKRAEMFGGSCIRQQQKTDDGGKDDDSDSDDGDDN